MNNQIQPIHIPTLDPKLHTRENNYRCTTDPTCPCRAGDLWTGAMMWQARNTAKMQAIAKSQNDVPTEQLPPMPDGFTALIGDETWRTEARHRRKIGLWRKIIKHLFSKKG
jgi:hypothetical protein